ncbi:MAG TPA: hemerythrin domain-containing protein [Blastocatellia bacterium]|nr:hemerythrin domain-containing protein [Blastocatellia bacterium]
MSNPIHTLKHEHRVIELGLRALNGICLRLGSNQAVPPAALIQVHDFIRAFTDRYHHWKEELYFFPALERKGIRRQGGPLGALVHQHEVERELVAELYRAISGYTAGDAESVRRFVNAARRYIELLTCHMEREDQILFRLAEELFDEADKVELDRAFKRAEAIVGQCVLETFEQVARELEKTWAV